VDRAYRRIGAIRAGTGPLLRRRDGLKMQCHVLVALLAAFPSRRDVLVWLI
jgi:hypothetical protein